MAQWRLRPPIEFPRLWHALMQERAGKHVLWVARTRATIERQQVEWRLFQYSLRYNPGHETAKHLDGEVTRRTKIEVDFTTGDFVLWLYVRPSTKSVFADAEVIEK